MRRGIYRTNAVTIIKKITLQPYPNEKVWIKGSLEVTHWVPEGNLWRKDNWPYRFTLMSEKSPRFMQFEMPQEKRIVPAVSDYKDMLFINGKWWQQVLTKAEVNGSTFYLDYNTKQIYLGTNPKGKTIEVTAHASGLSVAAAGSIIRGLRFSHYAEAGLNVIGPDIVVENCTIAGIVTKDCG